MKFEQLVAEAKAAQGSGFWYIGSPYSKWPLSEAKAIQLAHTMPLAPVAGETGTWASKDEATSEVDKVAMRLWEAGVQAFCPISHSHGPSKYQRSETNTHSFWVDQVDGPLIRASMGLIVVKMLTWEFSTGLDMERKAFAQACKPELLLDWPIE